MITLPGLGRGDVVPSAARVLDHVVRRTGATLPMADPRPSHGAEMEGWFWRCTDVPTGRVLVVLCGVNRHPDGPWATVAVAAHPGGFVRSTVLDGAHAAPDTLLVQAGDGAFLATERSVHVDLGVDCRVDLRIDHPVEWPLRLGGGGLFSALPWLGQYWHPHLLGGRVSGTARLGAESFELHGADVYAEKNWGHGFPERWWWGQAQGFADDACVAFGGGVLTAGPATVTVGGLVVRVGAQVVRFTPPWSRVRTLAGGDRWEVTARRPGQWARVVGHGVGEPHVLPVPIPAERRNEDTDIEFLAGRLHVELGGRTVWRGTSSLAGLEVGTRPRPRTT